MHQRRRASKGCARRRTHTRLLTRLAARLDVALHVLQHVLDGHRVAAVVGRQPSHGEQEPVHIDLGPACAPGGGARHQTKHQAAASRKHDGLAEGAACPSPDERKQKDHQDLETSPLVPNLPVGRVPVADDVCADKGELDREGKEEGGVGLAEVVEVGGAQPTALPWWSQQKRALLENCDTVGGEPVASDGDGKAAEVHDGRLKRAPDPELIFSPSVRAGAREPYHVVDAQHDGKERAHKVSVAIRHPRRLLAIGPRVQPEIPHAALLRGLDDRAERGGVERESVMLARDATVRDDGEFAQRAPLAIRAAPQEAVSLPELGHDASSGVRISFGSPQRRGEAAHVHAE
mmetsp:Transcript_1823/g.5990  ORF Transcript_1823/g.5990 Transcript_1823/m.5990 type:complete len:347 (+) Transcript_1823:1245-2285(+)